MQRARFTGSTSIAAPAQGLSGPASETANPVWARFDGCVLFTEHPRSEVARLLPPGARLAQGDVATHRLVWAFGQQSACAMRIGAVQVERDVAYWELALFVPEVRMPRSSVVHTYVPRMISSYYLSNWTGRVHFGFGKQPAEMGWYGPTFSVHAPGQGLLFQATMEEPAARDAENRADAVERLRDFARPPVCGYRPAGVLVRSRQTWGFERADVESVSAMAQIHAPFARGLRTGTLRCSSADAYRVTGMTWGLTWPQPMLT